MAQDNNGPAFPLPIVGPDEDGRVATSNDKRNQGMTLWDYFAAHAEVNHEENMAPKITARIKSEIADAVLAERTKRFGKVG